LTFRLQIIRVDAAFRRGDHWRWRCWLCTGAATLDSVACVVLLIGTYVNPTQD
jgi:hypothetical protein